ncbi:NusA-like transcription termination signal-binding factor [Candidatus Micrarchaeota archaeon]|nr:NusA-like transcription termination signal-binding factor [Candidatus Micrarchaeota archaeon]MBD3418035.1 NusA-like transcription termination signal-binding factor [Candidatus Micrarchaeota archaeon]
MEITGEDLKLINLFESVTGVIPSDMEAVEDGIVFLVDEANLGKAIGKKGANIQKLRTKLRKNVLVSKDGDDPEEFIRGFFNNIDILSFEIREAPGQKVAFIAVPDTQRGIAIGRAGIRVKAAKAFLKKKFGTDLMLKTRRVG